ncbi:MAG: transporter [Desulfobacterales bacterium]
MSEGTRKWIFSISILLGMTLMCSQTSFAGFLGHNAKGDYGLQSGTQLAPGFYVNPYYYRYVGDSLKDKNGDSVQIDPEGRGSLDINAYVLGFHWVSEFKILGGNYGIQIYPAFTDNTLEVPILGLEDSVDTGFSDLYFQPVNLGWHTDRADFSIGFGVTAPTGEYEPGGSDNTGLGMWSFEFFAGTTIYFDKAKSWHLALMAFYETHTEKEDSDIRVGDILTLEGGLGKSFMDGALSVGAAYYAQWKITDDDLGNDYDLLGAGSLGKYQVYGVGPEITVPLASSKKLYGFLNARYLWEFDAESTLQGDTFVLTFLFPIPSWPLQ